MDIDSFVYQLQWRGSPYAVPFSPKSGVQVPLALPEINSCGNRYQLCWL